MKNIFFTLSFLGFNLIANSALSNTHPKINIDKDLIQINSEIFFQTNGLEEMKISADFVKYRGKKYSDGMTKLYVNFIFNDFIYSNASKQANR